MVAEICQKSKVEIKSFPTHTLFDLEMLYQKNDKTTPENYTGFLGILNKHGLSPNKPIETFEGIKSLSLPPGLESDKVTNLDGQEFYEKTPKLSEMPKYNGHKPSAAFKGGQTQALAIMEKYM